MPRLDATNPPPAVDVLGLNGRYRDPLWRLDVDLSLLESELLRSWWIRRLAFVAHAGAAAITTVQSYSRLEHSMGVLALTAYFRPDDQVARAAALVHDIGHLPFSHTFEGVAGLDHHVLGGERLQELASVLQRYGIGPADLAAHEELLRDRTGRHLGLDHLDSFVRSGQAHGRTTTAPALTLRRLRLIDDVVDTDGGTAGYLQHLMIEEAAGVCSSANVTASAVLRDIASTLLESASPARRRSVAEMTDHQFWAAIVADDRTATAARRLLQHPESWTAQRVTDDERASGPDYTIGRIYTAQPTVGGQPAPEPGGLPRPPLRFSINDALPPPPEKASR